MLTDSFNRIHNYLRISLTDNCNLRCFYCMPEEEYDFTPPSRLMQATEIVDLARLFTRLGVDKIRLTGGEPLVRRDASQILTGLSKLPVTLTLTTNGTRLHEFESDLRESGIRSLNISLDTLQPETFFHITRRDMFPVVMNNIARTIALGLQVRVNAVIMKGVNEGELSDFVAWTRDTPVHVRFIEFMPFSGNRWTSNQVFTWKEMLARIGEHFAFERLEDEPHGTAKTYRVPGHAGTFSVISTMSAPFCETCNRLRLTADGKLKNCLFSRGETDLLSAWRRSEDVEALIRENVFGKAERLGGQFDGPFGTLHAETLHNRSMITIGG